MMDWTKNVMYCRFQAEKRVNRNWLHVAVVIVALLTTRSPCLSVQHTSCWSNPYCLSSNSRILCLLQMKKWSWLVVGPPLWKIWVRQLGCLTETQYMGKQKMATKPPTSDSWIYLFLDQSRVAPMFDASSPSPGAPTCASLPDTFCPWSKGVPGWSYASPHLSRTMPHLAGHWDQNLDPTTRTSQMFLKRLAKRKAQPPFHHHSHISSDATILPNVPDHRDGRQLTASRVQTLDVQQANRKFSPRPSPYNLKLWRMWFWCHRHGPWLVFPLRPHCWYCLIVYPTIFPWYSHSNKSNSRWNLRIDSIEIFFTGCSYHLFPNNWLILDNNLENNLNNLDLDTIQKSQFLFPRLGESLDNHLDNNLNHNLELYTIQKSEFPNVFSVSINPNNDTVLFWIDICSTRFH